MTDTASPSPTRAEQIRVVAAGFISLCITSGIGYYVFPVYMGVFESELGWTLTEMSTALLVWGIVGTLVSPLCGRLIDRLGPRRVMIAGTLIQIVSVMVMWRATHLWQLYAALILTSVANVANTYVPVSAAVSNWFDKDRGKAFAIALFGLGVGGMAMSAIANAFLEYGQWRDAYLFFAALLVIELGVIVWGIRDRARAGAEIGKADVEASEGVESSLSVAAAFGTRTFWTLGFGDGLAGLVFAVFNVHLVYFAVEAGMDQTLAATAFGVFQLLQVLGIIVVGALADRFSLRALMTLSYGMPAIATLALFRVDFAALLFVFAIVAGFFGGGRTALYPLTLTHSFGTAHFGAIYGALNTFFMVGSAVGPLVAGYLHDRQGDYRLTLGLCVGLAGLSGILIATMRNERPGA